jgi:bacterioferritin-associated ferredoxin
MLAIGEERLKAEIQELQGQIQIRLPSSNSGTDDDGMSAVHSTNETELQHEMEIKVQELAELQEGNRVKAAQEEAVATGFVSTLTRVLNLGECPVCFEEIPNQTYWEEDVFHRCRSCGIATCGACARNIKQMMRKEVENLSHGGDVADEATLRHLCELERLEMCPFCREKSLDDESDFAKTLRHAKAGKAWAQSLVGFQLAYGMGTAIDRREATRWCRLAADQGDLDALTTLGRLRYQDYAEGGKPQYLVEAKNFFYAAAVKGHAEAQHYCASVCMEDEYEVEALRWCTLSAGQGYFQSQFRLGQYFSEGSCGLERSSSKAVFWLKKAAIQDHAEAQVCLAMELMEAKREIYGGCCDPVGYSVMPEVFFWIQRAAKNGFEVAESMLQTLETSMGTQCGCCRIPAEEGVTFGRCVRCKTIGYCGRECQRKHWKMGHKVDCAVPDELKNRFDN